MTLAAALPPLANAATRLGRRALGKDTMPLWTSDLPRGGRRRLDRTRDVPSAVGDQGGASAVLFAACVGTMFGPAAGGVGATAALQALCERAGLALALPPALPSLCCGTPWKSKGMAQGYAVMQAQVLPALWEASRGGELPVICDASSCTEGLHELLRSSKDQERASQLRVVDAVAFVHEHVLEHLTISGRLKSVAVHPTCSSTRLGTTASITAIAASFAEEVVIPPDWGCCAFAGDRGLLHPELTASATAAEVAGLGGRAFDAYVASNRTCELGMTRATGHEYRHVLEVLEEMTR